MATSYTEYVVRRVIQALPVLFGLSVLIFTITRIIPGDPVRLALGPTATEEQVIRLRREMGLDEPIYIQYIDWIIGVFQGDWGQSLRTGNNVLTDIIHRFPATLELVLFAVILAVALAIPFGVIAGTHQNRWQDHVSRFGALFGISMPRFWVAILLQVVFAVFLGFFPLIGRISDNVAAPPSVTHLYVIDSLLAGQWATFIDVVQHLALPVVAQATATLAVIMRLIRSEIIEEDSKDYILAARSYGLPRNLVEYKYMLKNSFSSALTVIGLEFGFLIGNAFLVEIVFVWPGMARYGADAIVGQDFNAVVGVVMVIGVTFIFVNLAVDLLYGYFDPRVRLEESN